MIYWILYCFKGVKGEFLVATKFFQVSCSFSMIFIKFFKIPWYFQVFQVYSHFSRFSRFSRSSGNPEKAHSLYGITYFPEYWVPIHEWLIRSLWSFWFRLPRISLWIIRCPWWYDQCFVYLITLNVRVLQSHDSSSFLLVISWFKISVFLRSIWHHGKKFSFLN